MDYGITDELREIQNLTRRFVETELLPHERAVEAEDVVPPALRRQLRQRAVELGLFAFNMPAEAGGPGGSAVAKDTRGGRSRGRTRRDL